MKRPGLRGSFWPSDDDEALLRACLSLEAAPALAAWRSIEPALDIDVLPGEGMRLLPLLGASLRAHGVESPVLPRLRGMYRKAWMFNQILLARTGDIVRELDEAGVPSMVLKGCAIALRFYGDIGLRPMGDIDVLVPAERIDEAVSRLTSRGWIDETERRPGTKMFRDTHAYYLTNGPEIGCDLHWTIGEHMLLGPDQDPTPLFWPRSERLDVADALTLALCPTDQLLHVIVHGAQPGSASRLQWVADAVMILRSGEVDWARVEELAIHMRATIRISDALAYLGQAFVPEAVPADAVGRLRAYPVPRTERIEYALASRHGGGHIGMFPATFASYVRETRGWTLARRTRLFPRYLQEMWDLERTTQVPGAALRKALTTLRGRRSPDAGA